MGKADYLHGDKNANFALVLAYIVLLKLVVLYRKRKNFGRGLS